MDYSQQQKISLEVDKLGISKLEKMLASAHTPLYMSMC